MSSIINIFKTETLISQVIIGQPVKDGVFVTLCPPVVIKRKCC